MDDSRSSLTRRSAARRRCSCMAARMRSSEFGETSEALFLTQGFVYPTMEAAESRFKGEEQGFIYSRFANPDGRDVRTAHGAA